MKARPTAVTVRLSELAQFARVSLMAMCQADGSFDSKIWLKPTAGDNGSQIHKLFAEYSRLLRHAPAKGATKSTATSICVTLRWLFPTSLLELVEDATQVKSISSDDQTLALALRFIRLFAGEGVTIRFRPEAFAFGVAAEAYKFEELARTALANLVNFVNELLHRRISVNEQLELRVDSEPLLFEDPYARRRRLILLLVVLFPEFRNEDLCALYDGSPVETSKTCGRVLEDLAELLPGLDWTSKSAIKTVSGVSVHFEGDREAITSNCRDFLLGFVKSKTSSTNSTIDSSKLWPDSPGFPAA